MTKVFTAKSTKGDIIRTLATLKSLALPMESELLWKEEMTHCLQSFKARIGRQNKATLTVTLFLKHLIRSLKLYSVTLEKKI